MKIFFLMALMAIALCACKGNKQTNGEADENNISQNAENDNLAANDGQVFNFALAMKDGTEVNVLDEVKAHKVTIIDFWASWCGPCCAEMPNMVSIYKDYGEKGLGIVGISLDQDYDEWTTAMDELGITWTSLLDTDGSIAERFGVEYIPFTVIANQEGEILKTNLRGDELRQFVAGLLE